MQQTLLGMLRADHRVWSIGEMGEALAEELAERGAGDPAATVRAAVGALIEAGLAHRVSYELACVSRRGLIAKTAEVDAPALETSPEGTTGVFREADDGRELREADDGRELRGGAEGCLSGGLAPLVPRRAGQ
jgi:hypothetical protein